MALPIMSNGSGLLGGYLANRLQGLQSPLSGGQSVGPTPGQTTPTMAERMASAPTANHTMYGQYGGYFDNNGHYTTSRNNGTGSAASLALQANQAAAGYTNPNDPRLQAGRPLSNYMQQNNIAMGNYTPPNKAAVNSSFTWDDYDKALANQTAGGNGSVMPNLNTTLTQPGSSQSVNSPYGAGYTGFGNSSLSASGNPVYNGGQPSSGGSGSGGPSGTNNNGGVPNYYAGGGALGLGMMYKPIAPAYTTTNPFQPTTKTPIAPAPTIKPPTTTTSTGGGGTGFTPTFYVKPQ